MTLTLRIVNMTTLPDGGQVEYTCTQGRFELGRDTAMDWTLPDPNRFVSSCHADIRWENGAYWLYDVSTNGTFVNGASMRVKSPYQLQNGDKLQIGHYLVGVSVAAAPAVSAAEPGAPLGGSGPGAHPFGGDAFGGAPGSGADGGFGVSPPPGGFGASDPFGAGAGSDPFGSAPFGGSGAAAAGADSFGAQDDPWAFPGVPAADADAFGAPVPPPSAGDAGDDLIGLDFGTPSPNQTDQGGSPFGAPTQQAAPASPGADSPFGGAPVPPAGQGRQDSPFGAVPPTAEGSPFGDSAQTAPPSAAHAASQAAVATATAPAALQTPASEGFGGTPPMPRAAPGAAPAMPQSPAPRTSGGDADILRAICEGAGLPADSFSGSDPRAVGYEIGQSLRIVASELAAVLKVRSKSKRLYEKSGRTEIGREDNNPLKFTPTPTEALQTMFGPPRPGFMRGAQTMQSSFDDIKQHQFAVQAALQPALAKLIDDLRPEVIEEKVGGGRFGSKSAKAWELFVERWDAKTHPYENGMLDVFQAYFAEAYNKASQGK